MSLVRKSACSSRLSKNTPHFQMPKFPKVDKTLRSCLDLNIGEFERGQMFKLFLKKSALVLEY